MNKKLLSKVERPTATEEMFCLAKRTDGEKYIVTANLVDVEGKTILLLNFFQRSALAEKKSEAKFRTFLSKTDYITQDLTSARVKWKTGSFKILLNWYYWNTQKIGHDIIFASDQDFDRTYSYMKSYLEEDLNIWNAIKTFQDEVMDRRLTERHKKETDKIDCKMELVPSVPEKFETWAHEVAMEDKRYLVYKAAGKRKVTTGYCTHCRRVVELNLRVIHLQNKKRGICPVCESPVTFIPEGYFPAYQRDSKWVCLIQNIPTGIIVARYFQIYQEIYKKEGYKEKFEITELCRAFFEKDGNETLSMDSYEWGVYKQHGKERWCPDQNRKACTEAVVYTENLPEAFQETVYQYCALDLYQKKCGCNPISVWHFMKTYPSNCYLELLLKLDLVNLANDVVNGYDYDLNTVGKTAQEILGIPKNYISILRKINGSHGELKLLKQCAADGIFPQAEDIREFKERFGGNDELIGVINHHMSIRRFNRYMDKQRSQLPKQEETCGHAVWYLSPRYSKEERAKREYKDLARDWLDYISWCVSLKYDLKDNYVLLPPDLKKAHDRVMKEYQSVKDEIERKRQKEMEKQIQEVLNTAAGSPAISMKANGLMVILPKNGDEIKEEGRRLHHCVGSYVERVAKGETMILFIRKETEPTVPYFTLEYKNGAVVQCRGRNNCSMSGEVQAFVRAFEKKMQMESKKKQPGNERKAG